MDAFITGLQAFHFLRPWWLLALPLGLCIAWLLRRHAARTDWQGLIDPPLLQALLQRPSQESRLTPQRLANIVLCLWVLALAGPSWQQQASPWMDDQAPLVIALYLGDSMAQQDRQPSRLEVAKAKISALLDTRLGAATALIAYRGTAHNVLPLTEDVTVLSHYLNDLQPDVMPSEGNRPDLALAQAGQLLAGQGGSVVLVLDSLTDFIPLQDDWNPLPDGAQASAWLLATDRVELADTAKLLDSVDIDSTAASPDDKDVQQLQGQVQQRWQQQLQDEGDQQWHDAGYYLLWPLLLMSLLWFRRGMVLPW